MCVNQMTHKSYKWHCIAFRWMEQQKSTKQNKQTNENKIKNKQKNKRKWSVDARNVWIYSSKYGKYAT